MGQGQAPWRLVGNVGIHRAQGLGFRFGVSRNYGNMLCRGYADCIEVVCGGSIGIFFSYSLQTGQGMSKFLFIFAA